MDKELTREELFLLVWERPTQEIARELGISDVALAKRCRKLQIPKPPRGYWAKIRSGKLVKKPLLKAFSDQLVERQRTRTKKRQLKQGWVGLSPLQAEIFKRAIDELSAAGVNLGNMEYTHSGVRYLEAELAARILILIQHRMAIWLKDRAGSNEVGHASIQSVQALATKLLPLAKPHTLILEAKREEFHNGDNRTPKIIIRLTHEFQQQVANLYRLVRKNNLSYVVYDLSPFEHALIVQYHHHYQDSARAKSQLCVTTDTLWIHCRVKRHTWYDDYDEVIETSEIPLSAVAPVDLIPAADIVVPTSVDLPKLSISKGRIKAFQDAENVYDILSSAVYKLDFPVPDDHLALLERLQSGGVVPGPFSAVREALQTLESDLERWELVLDAEREAICAEALGLAKGDTILTESRGKPVRLKIDRMSAQVVDEHTLTFYITGTRYRKDGLLGQRQDYIYISTKSDQR